MRQIIYIMQFKGQAAPAGESSNVLKTMTTAPSCIITTVASPEGVEGTVQSTAGDNAAFGPLVYPRTLSFYDRTLA